MLNICKLKINIFLTMYKLKKFDDDFHEYVSDE